VSLVGQILDPVADRVYILATLLGFGWRGVIGWWFVAAILGRDATMALTQWRLVRAGHSPLPVQLLGKAATLNLLYAFPLLLLAHHGGSAAAVARPWAWAFAWWGVALYWWAAARYWGQAWVRLRPGQSPVEGSKSAAG
jgi:cardiolipin synthase